MVRRKASNRTSITVFSSRAEQGTFRDSQVVGSEGRSQCQLEHVGTGRIEVLGAGKSFHLVTRASR